MIGRRAHLVAFAVGVAGLELAASLGGDLEGLVAYGLAAGLGVVVYVQAERYLVPGSVFGNVLVGYVGGTILGLGVAGGLVSWVLALPLDFALWRAAILMWGSWAGIGATVLSTFFLFGLVATLR